jgi:hypothetical protein
MQKSEMMMEETMMKKDRWIEESTNQPWETNSPAQTTSHNVRLIG